MWNVLPPTVELVSPTAIWLKNKPKKKEEDFTLNFSKGQGKQIVNVFLTASYYV